MPSRVDPAAATPRSAADEPAKPGTVHSNPDWGQAGATGPGCHEGRYLIVGVGYIRPAGRIYATPTARGRAAPGVVRPVVRGGFQERLRNLETRFVSRFNFAAAEFRGYVASSENLFEYALHRRRPPRRFFGSYRAPEGLL